MRKWHIIFIVLIISGIQSYPQFSRFNTGASLTTGSESNWLNKSSDNPTISSWYTDIGLVASGNYGSRYLLGVDLKYRIGSEFGNSCSYLRINEVWGGYDFGSFEIAAGKKILAWGGNISGFDNHTFNPVDYLYRTTDHGSRRLGTYFASLLIRPLPLVSIEFLLSPLLNPSVLPVKLAGIPDFVEIEDLSGRPIPETHFSGGVNLRFSRKGVDGGVTLFSGSDPTPFLSVTEASIDTAGGILKPQVSLDQRPVRISVISASAEIQAGSIIIRGEGAYINGGKSDRESGILFSEVALAAGTEFTILRLSVIVEYGYRYLLNFEAPGSLPFIPETIPQVPPEYLPSLMAGFKDYTKETMVSFNRLLRYQSLKNYHNVTLSLNHDLLNDNLNVSLSANYNISAGELFLSPIIKYDAADGVTLLLGADIYNGKDNSLFDMIGPSLTSLYAGFKIEL